MGEKLFAELCKRLGTEDASFAAFRDSLPDNAWARYDLSAVRVGWEAAKHLLALESAGKVDQDMDRYPSYPATIHQHRETSEGSLADVTAGLLAAAKSARASMRQLAHGAGDVEEWNEGGHAYEAARQLDTALTAADVPNCHAADPTPAKSAPESGMQFASGGAGAEVMLKTLESFETTWADRVGFDEPIEGSDAVEFICDFMDDVRTALAVVKEAPSPQQATEALELLQRAGYAVTEENSLVSIERDTDAEEDHALGEEEADMLRVLLQRYYATFPQGFHSLALG